MFCHKCGHKMDDSQKFCHRCGQSVNDSGEEKTPTKKVEVSKTESNKKIDKIKEKDTTAFTDFIDSHHNKNTKSLKNSGINYTFLLAGFIFGALIIAIVIGAYFSYAKIINYQLEQTEREKQAQELIKSQNSALEKANKDIEELKKASEQANKEIGVVKKATEDAQKESEGQIDISTLLNASNTYSSGGSSPSIYLAESIAKILCDDHVSDYYITGSGSLWYNDGKYWIVTNKHVLEDMVECVAIFTLDWASATDDYEAAFNNNDVLIYSIPYDYYFYESDSYDLAFAPLEIYPEANQPINLLQDYAMVPDPENCSETYPIGTDIHLYGYPGIGSDTIITMTEGIISSWEKIDDFTYYIVSAKIDSGNSGGAAFIDTSENSSCFIGIPTFGVTGEIESLGRVLLVTEKTISEILTL